MLYRNGSVDYKIWGVVQQCIYVNKDFKICDICDLQKRLTQTWADFEQNVIEAAIEQWRDRLRSCLRAAKPRVHGSPHARALPVTLVPASRVPRDFPTRHKLLCNCGVFTKFADYAYFW